MPLFGFARWSAFGSAGHDLPGSGAPAGRCATVGGVLDRSLETDGLAGLLEGERPGRPRRLGEKQMAAVDRILRRPPRAAGLTGNIWDGKTLSTWIEQKYGVRVGIRQCQRMFRQLGFRLRKPRPALAQANPELQKDHKKNYKT
jgi:transposase